MARTHCLGYLLQCQFPSPMFVSYTYMQVFPESRPVALAEVDCVGNETSLLDGPSRLNPDVVLSDAQCGNSTDATILGCGDSEAGAVGRSRLTVEGVTKQNRYHGGSRTLLTVQQMFTDEEAYRRIAYMTAEGSSIPESQASPNMVDGCAVMLVLMHAGPTCIGNA